MPAGCEMLQKPTDGIWRAQMDWAIGSFQGSMSSGGALRSALANDYRGLAPSGEGSGISSAPAREFMYGGGVLD
jgi:hypothetical protein